MKRLLAFLLLPFAAFAQTQHDRSVNRGTSTFDTYKNTATVVITGATPSVSTGNVFKTNNGSTTTVTNFTGGTDSQRIVILCGEANTIIANNANISIAGGTNYSCVLNNGIEFVYDASQSKWIENGGTGTGGGGGGSPGAPATALQCNSGSGTFVACNATDNGVTMNVTENQTVSGNQVVSGTAAITGATTVGGQFTAGADSQLCGPNPMIDVRCYHVRALDPRWIPSVAGITGTINSTSNALAISTTNCNLQTVTVCFVNGDGIVIFGAGATHSMSTPGAPTVTPSNARVMTGTGDVVNSPTAATTYHYKVVASDIGRGLTAAGSIGTTTTGLATLGSQSVAITSVSRSGNVVTVVTSSAHGLTPGTHVLLDNIVDTTFNGNYQVATSADNTHFTYLQNLSTANGATPSSTGGTAYWWNANHVAWSAVTGAWQYYVCSDRASPGTYAVVGVSKPSQGGNFTDGTLYWDDFGSPMRDSLIAIPANITASICTAGSPTSDSLVTTITSGAGTTSLVLAANAVTSVSSAPVLFDNSPNIKSATFSGVTTFFPITTVSSGSYVTNSVLDLRSATGSSFSGGNLTLGDTLVLGSPNLRGSTYPNAGSQTSFQFEGYPTISCKAIPCVYITGGGSGRVEGLLFTVFSGNNNILVLQDGGGGSPGVTYERLNFSTTTSSDYMSEGLELRGASDSSSAGVANSMKEVTFLSGPAQTDGLSMSPTFYGNRGAALTMQSVTFSRRGMLVRADTPGGAIKVQWGYIQGGITPFMTVTGIKESGGVIGFAVDIKSVTMDTIPHSVLTYLPSAASLNLNANIGLTGNPGSNVNFVSGNPFSLYTGSLVSGINTNLNSIVGAGAIIAQSGTGQVGILMATPAAPTTSNISGTLGAGTYFYKIFAQDMNGGVTVTSPVSASCTSNGSQACLVSWTPVPGQAFTTLCRGASVGSTPCGGGGGTFNIVGSSFTDNQPSGAFNNSAPTATTALANSATQLGSFLPAVTLIASGVTTAITSTATATRTQATPDLSGTYALSNAAQTWSGNQANIALVTPSIGGETISASPRGPLNAILPGALTTTYTGQTWTLDKAITVTRLQTQLRVAPSGCGTNPIVRLSDGTNNVNLTLTAAANDSGSVSQAFAAAAVLTVSVQTAASGCTTSPGDANVAIEYKMQ